MDLDKITFHKEGYIYKVEYRENIDNWIEVEGKYYENLNEIEIKSVQISPSLRGFGLCVPFVSYTLIKIIQDVGHDKLELNGSINVNSLFPEVATKCYLRAFISVKFSPVSGKALFSDDVDTVIDPKKIDPMSDYTIMFKAEGPFDYIDNLVVFYKNMYRITKNGISFS